MAINPPSDLILDVVRAADPTRRLVASEKLQRLERQGDAAQFETVFQGLPGAHVPMDPAQRLVEIQNRLALHGTGGPNARAPIAGATDPAYQRFEAFILQSFIQGMLPRNGEQIYGKGVAGDIWKSMLAEQLGSQLAKAGGVGIAARLAAARPPQAAESTPQGQSGA